MRLTISFYRVIGGIAFVSALGSAHAQPSSAGDPALPPTPAAASRMPAPLVSPEVGADGRVTFRIRAPKANTVTLAGDVGQGLPTVAGARTMASPPPAAAVMELGGDGVWTGTTAGPVRPGAYRYVFSVDGVPTVDPSNVETSPSQQDIESLLVVPGDFSEERDVPHGALSKIIYPAPTYGQGTERTVYVYTPPGYEAGTQRYPVLYLLHGFGDTAASWATVGRANFIMDNLIAERKAQPFIVVMVSGWTPRGMQVYALDATKDPFDNELISTIIPMIDKRFRTKASREFRGIAGLSAGGAQTLAIGIGNLDTFAWVVPMSTGWFNDADRQTFVRLNHDAIASADRRLKLFWWGYGTTDIARENGLESMAALRSAGLHNIVTFETEGGHEWRSWRAMLHQYAPLLFR